MSSSSALNQIHQVLKNKDEFPFLSNLEIERERLHATIHFAEHLISGCFVQHFDCWEFYLDKHLPFSHPNVYEFEVLVDGSSDLEIASGHLKVFILTLWQLLHEPNFDDPFDDCAVKTKKDYLDQFDIKPKMSISTLRTFAFSTKDFCYFEGVLDIQDLAHEDFLAKAKALLVDYLKKGKLIFLAERAEALVLHSRPWEYIKDHPEGKVWLCDAPCCSHFELPSTIAK